MNLHNLKPNPGAKHRKKRLGCGESSGKGKTCGKGHKGQKSRSGASIRPGFEGGQMPLIRQLPKRGFNNAQFKTEYAIVNVGVLEERFEEGDVINETALRDRGLVKGRWAGVKILGVGELKKKFSVEADKVSDSAREKIEKAGGSIAAPAVIPDATKEPAADKQPVPAKKKAAPAKKKATAAKKKKAPASKKEEPVASEEEKPVADEAEEDTKE